jgi:hypothetical protein
MSILLYIVEEFPIINMEVPLFFRPIFEEWIPVIEPQLRI